MSITVKGARPDTRFRQDGNAGGGAPWVEAQAEPPPPPPPTGEVSVVRDGAAMVITLPDLDRALDFDEDYDGVAEQSWTAATTASVAAGPVAYEPPAIVALDGASGLIDGDTFDLGVGIWANDAANGPIAYAWSLTRSTDGAVLASGTDTAGTRYAKTLADDGATLTWEVSASDTAGSAVVTETLVIPDVANASVDEIVGAFGEGYVFDPRAAWTIAGPAGGEAVPGERVLSMETTAGEPYRAEPFPGTVNHAALTASSMPVLRTDAQSGNYLEFAGAETLTWTWDDLDRGINVWDVFVLMRTTQSGVPDPGTIWSGAASQGAKFSLLLEDGETSEDMWNGGKPKDGYVIDGVDYGDTITRDGFHAAVADGGWHLVTMARFDGDGSPWNIVGVGAMWTSTIKNHYVGDIGAIVVVPHGEGRVRDRITALLAADYGITLP